MRCRALPQHRTGFDRHQVALQLSERIAKLHMVLNQLEAAEREFSRMIEAARSGGNRAAEGEGLAWQSLIRARMNRMAEASATADAALEAAAEANDDRVSALAQRSRAHLHVVHGELGPAADYASRGAQLARDGNHLDVLGPCLYDLGLMAVWRGNYEEAERLAREALQSGDRHPRRSDVHQCIASASDSRVPNLAATRRLATRYSSGSMPRSKPANGATWPSFMNTLGTVFEELGDFDAARTWNRRALEATRTGQDASVMEAERYTLLNLASTELHRGDVAAATRLPPRRRTIARPDPVLTVSLLQSLSTVARGARARQWRLDANPTLGGRGTGARRGEAHRQKRREELATRRSRAARWRLSGRRRGRAATRSGCRGRGGTSPGWAGKGRYWLGQALHRTAGLQMRPSSTARPCSAWERSRAG